MYFQGKSLQYLLFCAGSFSCLQSGLHLGWSSYALPQLLRNDSTIPLTNDEGSWIASIFFVGSVFGGIIGGLTIDVFGRKTMLLVASLPTCGCWLAIAYARSPLVLYLARFVSGVSDGMLYACLPLYLAEICDPKIRGFLISATVGIYIFGLFVANLLGEFLDMFLVAIISGSLSLGTIFYLFVPESPHFYLIKGNFNKAKGSLEKFAECKDGDNLLVLLRNSLKGQESKKGMWWELFTVVNNRKFLGLVVLARVFQQFCGFIGIALYAQTVFIEFEEYVRPVISVSIFYLLQVIVVLITSLIVDRVGRKFLLVSSMVVVSVSLFIVSTYFTLENVAKINVTAFSLFPIAALFLYVIGFTFGLLNVPFILLSELFPLHVKTCAGCIFSIMYGLTSVTSSKFFQYTKDEFGMHVPFIVFALVSTCGIPFSIFCVPETKRKTLEEIQTKLNSNRKR